jgi:tRNA(Ile)-lysidine synthase
MAVAAGCDLVLLAHHRQDQAETWLLQALRGAGAAGLSAMPERAARHGIVWARPWLHRPRGEIDEYVRRHRLSSVEDPSNADVRYARSRLRQRVWPALTAAFPEAEVAFAAAAARAQDSASLADEVAAEDLPKLVQDKALCVAAWQALPPARRLNALRAWLRSTSDAPPPQTLLQRLQLELVTADSGRWPAPGGELRLHRGRLWAVPEAAAVADVPTEPPPLLLDLSHPGFYPLAGWGGHFATHAVGQGGVTPDCLRALQPRLRLGGERLRLAPRAADRALKKQFQALGIPAWRREGPLLYTPDGHLLFVPGLGLNAEFWAKAGVPQLSVCWVSDPMGAVGASPSIG